MRKDRGFTLLEAAFGSVVLMLGIVTLIHISTAFMNQIKDIRVTEGQPAIEERLVHGEISLLCGGGVPGSPAAVPTVPPLVTDGTTYSVIVTKIGSPGGNWPSSVYSIVASPSAPGAKASAPVYFNKGTFLCF